MVRIRFLTGVENRRLVVWTETKDPGDAERAIDDAKIALTLTPNNPLALANGLIAYVRTIELKESQGEGTTQLRIAAERLVSALGRWPKYALGRNMRATHFSLTDQPDLVDKEEEALRELGAGGYYGHVASSLEQDRIADQHNVTNSGNPSWLHQSANDTVPVSSAFPPNAHHTLAHQAAAGYR